MSYKYLYFSILFLFSINNALACGGKSNNSLPDNYILESGWLIETVDGNTYTASLGCTKAGSRKVFFQVKNQDEKVTTLDSINIQDYPKSHIFVSYFCKFGNKKNGEVGLIIFLQLQKRLIQVGILSSRMFGLQIVN